MTPSEPDANVIVISSPSLGEGTRRPVPAWHRQMGLSGPGSRNAAPIWWHWAVTSTSPLRTSVIVRSPSETNNSTNGRSNRIFGAAAPMPLLGSSASASNLNVAFRTIASGFRSATRSGRGRSTSMSPPSKIREAMVVRAEALVRVSTNDRHAGNTLENLETAVGRGIVDDDDIERTEPVRTVHRIHSASEQRSAVVVHDDNAQPRFDRRHGRTHRGTFIAQGADAQPESSGRQLGGLPRHPSEGGSF